MLYAHNETCFCFLLRKRFIFRYSETYPRKHFVFLQLDIEFLILYIFEYLKEWRIPCCARNEWFRISQEIQPNVKFFVRNFKLQVFVFPCLQMFHFSRLSNISEKRFTSFVSYSLPVSKHFGIQKKKISWIHVTVRYFK